MPTILKCPNPSCPFQFDAATVPPGATVACPQCQSRFTLGPAVPVAAAPAAAPLLPGEPAVPPAEPRRPKRPRVIERAAAPNRNTSTASSILIALFVVGGLTLVTGGVAGVGYVLGWFTPPDPTANAPAVTFDDYHIGLPKAADGWTRDEPTRAALGVNLLAFKRTAPDGWMAVEAKKFDFAAKPGELRPRAYDRLKAQFDELDEELKGEEAKVFGQPGERYEFRGVYRPASVGVRGEVFACVVQNYAYWVYLWAPADGYEQLADSFARFRAGIRLTVPAGKAPPPPKKTEKYFRTKGGLFLLADAEGLWTEQADPTTQDAAAELWLRGANKGANLVVAVLPLEGEPKTQAREHILKQFVADGSEVAEQTGDPTGDAPSSGEVPPSDAVTRIKVTDRERPSANKLIVFGTLDVADKRVVAYATCPLKEASYWEQRLMLIVGTLKAGK
jgi:hypothetical protein